MFSFVTNVDRSGRNQRNRRRDRKVRPGLEGLEQRQVLSSGVTSPPPEIASANAPSVTIPVRLGFGDLVIEKNGANIGKALLNWYITVKYDKQTKFVAGSNPNDPNATMGDYSDWEHIPINKPQTINVIATPNNTITVEAYVEHAKGRGGERVMPTMVFRYDPASRSFIHFDSNSRTDVHTASAKFHSEYGNLRASLTTTLNLLNNDDFANAQGLSGPTPDTYGTTATAVGSNVNFTGQAGETNHATVSGSNISSGTLNSAWYKWVAPASGNVTIDTFNSNFDTTLAVYTGSAVDALTLADFKLAYCDDAYDNNDVWVRQSSVTFAATAGRTYWIAVDGWANYTGTINLNLAMRPSNDKFADAQVLSGATATAVGSNVNATGQARETNHANLSSPLASIWYTWTAPRSGNVTIDTFNSSFDTTLAVYTGDAVDSLTLVDPRLNFGYNDDSIENGVRVLQSSVTFAVTAGTRYRIAVAGYRGATGNVQLRVRMI